MLRRGVDHLLTIREINIGYNRGLGIMMKLSNGIVIVALSLSFLALNGCGDSAIFDCDKELKSRITSPDGEYAAGILTVQCGATTADATWVLLGKAGDEYDYDRDKVAVFEGSNVELNWHESLLQVIYYEARPFKMNPSAKGVSIEYQNRRIRP